VLEVKGIQLFCSQLEPIAIGACLETGEVGTESFPQSMDISLEGVTSCFRWIPGPKVIGETVEGEKLIRMGQQ
jgi:hypothetical protein